MNGFLTLDVHSTCILTRNGLSLTLKTMEDKSCWDIKKLGRVTGIGSIKLKLANGVTWILQRVRHVLELKGNLISLGMLNAQGYEYKAEGGVLKVKKCSMVMMKGKLVNGLYLF